MDDIIIIELVNSSGIFLKYYDVNKDKLFSDMPYFEEKIYSNSFKNEYKYKIKINDIEEIFIYDILFTHLNNNEIPPSLFTNDKKFNELPKVLTIADNFCYDKFIHNVSFKLTKQNIKFTEIIYFFDNPILISNLLDSFLLRYSSRNGYTSFVKLFLEDGGSDPSAKKNEAIVWASTKNHINIVKLLLEDKRVDPSARNNSSIIKASKNGHIEIIKLLLTDKRVNPSDQNNRAIILASDNGYTDIVKILLKDERVDPSAQNNKSLLWASLNGHIDIVKLFLENKNPRVNPNTISYYSKLVIFERGHNDILKLLEKYSNQYH